MWTKGTKEQVLINANPTWFKGGTMNTLNWMDWWPGDIKVLCSPSLPNILFSHSKFTWQNAGDCFHSMSLLERMPWMQTPICGPLHRHVLWKKKIFFWHSGSHRNLSLISVECLEPGQSCALWKHRQNKMFCPIRLTTTWGSRQDNAWRLNQSRSVPFSSIILWHQHSVTHVPSPHVALCHRCRNSPNFPSKTQYGPLNVYQSRLQGTRRQKHLKNFL